MSYKLQFHKVALKEWQKLDRTVQLQFKKKLAERLDQPHVPAALINQARNRYKIKLRASGYRLVYDMHDMMLVVKVIAIGKRERSQAYSRAERRWPLSG
ncbi:MAG: type II toxin-antitoxin system RelE/ParE family toxin [Rhodobacteraceae bacterium]|nr:type II toxin-antitoxin system RelE/ParE family toxin [Paracoccaceae bacterium]